MTIEEGTSGRLLLSKVCIYNPLLVSVFLLSFPTCLSFKSSNSQNFSLPIAYAYTHWNYHICHKFATFATSYVNKIINYYRIENSSPRYYLIILNKMPISKNLCRISRKLSKLKNLLVIKLYIMRLCWWLFNVDKKFINLHMHRTLLETINVYWGDTSWNSRIRDNKCHLKRLFLHGAKNWAWLYTVMCQLILIQWLT